jgi:isoleucyl-tRNA synthetase
MAGLKYGVRSFLTKPLQFVGSPQFRIVLGLYTSTYATANIVDTTCEQYSVESTTASMYKFISTSLVNIVVCVYKDRVFTSMFGTASNRAFPKLSYLLFAARDSLTIAASFTAPAYIADLLQKKEIVSTEKTAQVTAQLISPCAVQFLSTPVHLYALDLYNRPDIVSSARFQLIRKEYFKSALARIGRIGPAFGFGGVGNSYLRSFRNKI